MSRGLKLALIAALTATAPSTAHAQMGGLGAPTTVQTEEKTALGKLPRAVVDWANDEAIRQALSPGDLDTLDAEMSKAIGADLEGSTRRTRMALPDLVSALRYHVLREAGRLLDDDIRARQKLAGPSPTDDEVLAMATATSHRNRVRALQDQAERRLTPKAKAFIH